MQNFSPTPAEEKSNWWRELFGWKKLLGYVIATIVGLIITYIVNLLSPFIQLLFMHLLQINLGGLGSLSEAVLVVAGVILCLIVLVKLAEHEPPSFMMRAKWPKYLYFVIFVIFMLLGVFTSLLRK